MKAILSLCLGVWVLLSPIFLWADSEYPMVDSSWVYCQADQECEAVKLGCYFWQPVNKQYISQMTEKNRVQCVRTLDAGMKPKSLCRRKQCQLTPHTGEDWAELEISTIKGPYDSYIGRAYTKCLLESNLTLSDLDNQDNLELNEYLFQLVDQFISENPDRSQESIEDLIADAAPNCGPIIAKAKEVIHHKKDVSAKKEHKKWFFF